MGDRCRWSCGVTGTGILEVTMMAFDGNNDDDNDDSFLLTDVVMLDVDVVIRY